MPLYEVTSNQLKIIEETSFREARIRERADLQRHIVAYLISVVAPLASLRELQSAAGDELSNSRRQNHIRF